MIKDISWCEILVNLARIPSSFSSINYIFGWHWCPKFTLWDISFHMELISKQITNLLTCGGKGYQTCQKSRTMNFQWGITNRKSLVRHALTVPARIWRTMSFHTQWLHPSNVITCDVIDKLSIPWVSIQVKFQNSTSKGMTECDKHHNW